jgi:cytoplasmic iron level regulating protein YaaA (DUF328/UPF0246 family)
MKIVLSPAKSLNWEKPLPEHSASQPAFQSASASLISVLKKVKGAELMQLMDISPALADLNVARYKNWKKEHTEDNSRPALYAFDGDVYTGLDAYSMSVDAIQFADQHLRILSGLYGILKPFDLIQPYRLEMGTQLAVKEHSNLYGFWGNRIANYLNKEMERGEVLLNLASEEYFKVVPPKALKAKVIQPVFYDFKNGQYKIISFFAKKARGMMARYICDHQISQPEDIKAFDTDGYAYSEGLSKGDQWVFIRG